MFEPITVIAAICLYIGFLFLIALWVERKTSAGKDLANNALVYSLSLAVYCTSWTYYGSIGKAAESGMLFLAIYLGPTMAYILSWVYLRKVIRIKEKFRITSIADFVSARYGKSYRIAAIVTVIALVGSTPYIALQLKSVFSTFAIITNLGSAASGSRIWHNVDIIVVGLMIVFTIIFGIRRLDPTERHPGMMMVLAVECLVKLMAFLAAGIFITYFMFNGFSDIFERIAANLPHTLTYMGKTDFSSFLTWGTYLVLAMSAIMFLPRQFHVAVVENYDEKHIRTSMWLFPLYMLLINIFVFPIAMGGLLKGYPYYEADTFLLKLPIHAGQKFLSLFVFIGGFSAAIGMVMIATMTISTMVTNHLILPLIENIRWFGFLRRHLLRCRWAAATAFIIIGYWFERHVGGSYMLVNMGMLSFAAVLQFSPAIIGSLFWKRGNKAGAILGLSAGFLIWFYTLLIPAFVKSGWMSKTILEDGLWGIGFLRPEQLFGLMGLDPLTHAFFWTMFFNIGLYVLGSIYFETSKDEQRLADEFVNVLSVSPVFSRPAYKEEFIVLADKKREIETMLCLYFYREEAEALIEKCLYTAGIQSKKKISIIEFAELCNEAEKTLAGSIGAATAHTAIQRGMIFSSEESKALAEVYGEMLASLKITPSELQKKIDYYEERETILSHHAMELENTVDKRTKELREAYEKLKELDKQKTEFLSTVSHELRTPLTSLLGFSQIMKKKLEEVIFPNVKDEENVRKAMRQVVENIKIMVSESERLTAMINDVLDIAKMEAGEIEWKTEPLSVAEIIQHATVLTTTLFEGKGLNLTEDIEDGLPEVKGDRDRLLQVLLNLISNAVKFTDKGSVTIRARRMDSDVVVSVIDTGIGITEADQKNIFDKFKQVGDTHTGKPRGTGLGLPISLHIIELHGGRIWVKSEIGKGSNFSFLIPISRISVKRITSDNLAY